MGFALLEHRRGVKYVGDLLLVFHSLIFVFQQNRKNSPTKNMARSGQAKTLSTKERLAAMKSAAKKGASVASRKSAEKSIMIEKAAATKAAIAKKKKAAAAAEEDVDYEEQGPAHVVAASKKGHRFHPGTVALMEIKKFQNTKKLLIPALNVSRYVRGVVLETPFYEQNKQASKIGGGDNAGFRITAKALGLTHLGMERFMTHLAATANDNTVHSRRCMVKGLDVLLAQKVLGRMYGSY